MKTKAPASTHKKVVIELLERTLVRGYLNPARLPHTEAIDLLTPDGAHEEIPLARIRAVYFVRNLDHDISMDRKAFLSRPKLDGLWVRLRFQDGETLEGVIPNDLITLHHNGLQFTPPDFNSNADRVFVPMSALTECSVLGVVGVARRKPAAAAASQPRLFTDE